MYIGLACILAVVLISFCGLVFSCAFYRGRNFFNKVSVTIGFIFVVSSFSAFMVGVCREGVHETYYTKEYTDQHLCELLRIDGVLHIDASGTTVSRVVRLRLDLDPWSTSSAYSELDSLCWLHSSLNALQKKDCTDSGGYWSGKVDGCVHCD